MHSPWQLQVYSYASLELRLSVPDFVSQLWRKIGAVRQNPEWRAWVRGYSYAIQLVNSWPTVKVISTLSACDKLSDYMTLCMFKLLSCPDINPTVDCGAPPPPVNGFLQSHANTTEGSVAGFHCDPGFVPEGEITALCGSNGQWNPNPRGVICSPRLTQAFTPTPSSTPILSFSPASSCAPDPIESGE